MEIRETKIRNSLSPCTGAARTGAALVTVVALWGTFGCNRNQGEDTTLGADAAVEPDNTKRNEGDDRAGAITAQDQGGSEQDRAITQQVRQLVVKDDSLSTAAKNVKIVTIEGVVTLRGPVKSSEEKTTLATFAKNVEGVKRVDNELEVDAEK